ncbi:MAG: tRNA lysidine(34) synthetase TilS [Verrucomicrobia bacterium]|nr:tRNA lysidine(34) synthetase TilS [Verrucomicrobiota bacterium]
MNLVTHVERTLGSRKLLRDGQSVLVAVSGGVDSMVLLDVLHRLAPKHGWKLTVAHFNHLLRGRASDGDEKFVKAAAAERGLPFVSDRRNVRARQRMSKLSLEMAAREVRHVFLAREARSSGCAAIALAHHADDQAELFLIRLLRGAGGQGLGGMKWSSPSPMRERNRLVRPLLDVRKADLLTHARRNHIRFREDASNRSPDILRNRIRHELLPLLARKYQPSVVNVALRAMDITEAEAEFVMSAAQRWLLARRRPRFDRLHVAVQRQVLRTQLADASASTEFHIVEKLRLNPGKAFTAERGVRVWRDENGTVASRHGEPGGLTFKFSGAPLDLKPRRGERQFGGVRITWLRRPRNASDARRFRPAPGFERFDADKVGRFIRLRHWQPGDRFQPIGMDRDVKLQDLFTNAKIPAEERRGLIVAADLLGERSFWVEGLRIGESFKVTPRTKRVLEWRWERAPAASGSVRPTVPPAP